jgi:hypothetical protein
MIRPGMFLYNFWHRNQNLETKSVYFGMMVNRGPRPTLTQALDKEVCIAYTRKCTFRSPNGD